MKGNSLTNLTCSPLAVELIPPLGQAMPSYRHGHPILRSGPPPPRPRLSLAGCRLVCAASAGALRVAAISLYQASRRHCSGETGRRLCCSLPIRCQPSPFLSRVDFRIARFEDCSTFTHAAARMLAEPPYSGPSPRCASAHQVVTSSSSSSDCFWPELQQFAGRDDLHPLGL